MADHQKLRISRHDGIFSGTVRLTGSKSESNRALIIAALSNGKVTVENLSNAADTITMQDALKASGQKDQHVITIDIGPAGTAMRFLSAYLPLITDQEFVLTGTARMQQRPISILADALKTLGADITYVKEKGYPPLHISGGFKQQTDQININGNVSSQYLSALLLIAASLPLGLELHINDELASKPYVEMTLNMLLETGITHHWQDNTIRIHPQSHKESTLYVEPDWSAASYWYAMLALSESGTLFLPGLHANSLQGDRAIAEIMKHFGISSTFEPAGVRLSKTGSGSDQDSFDFNSCPDLAQTVIVCCAALGRDASFTGMETLKIKETDRIKALQNELGKFGVLLREEGNQLYRLDCRQKFTPASLIIHTYEDHRMAMAFAPLALLFDEMIIEDPQVVNKSYPDFWKDLEEQNFKIKNISG